LFGQNERQHWIDKWIKEGGRKNEALKYDVAIAEVNPQPGKKFALCLGVLHLAPQDNMGKHNVYIDLVDKDGKQLRGNYGITWDWKGRTKTEPAPTSVILDKPLYEAGGNLAMFGGQVVHVLVKDTVSDIVSGMHTYHPDEGTGNTIGHHSYYVAFQLLEPGVVPPTPPPEQPEPPTPPPDFPPPPEPPEGEELQQVYTAIGDIIVIMGQLQNLVKEVMGNATASHISAVAGRAETFRPEDSSPTAGDTDTVYNSNPTSAATEPWTGKYSIGELNSGNPTGN
jgi:hypothetical protein